MSESTLSESQQDYLKIILDLMHVRRVARIKEIAERKGVGMPSVIEAVRKLAMEGLVCYTAREFIELTEAGQQRANQLINRHTFLTRFLTDILHLPVGLAETEGCALEHHLNGLTLERLILLYQFLAHCPRHEHHLKDDFSHCMTILNGSPDSCNQCFTTETLPHSHTDLNVIHCLLTDLPEDQTARVIMLPPDSLIRQQVIELGLLPGVAIEVARQSNGQSPCIITIQGYRIELTAEQARLIEVSVARPDPNPLDKPQD